ALPISKTVEEALPIVAAPTTTGTGSEVTQYSVLLDPFIGRKVVMQGAAIIPRVALLDPDVTDYMPGRLVAGTGFDALSHALEAFLSRRASPLSDLFAREAATIILRELGSAARGDRAAREAMMYASMLAGVAINQAGSTMVHGLGYYLTAKHRVHHGMANALLLPYVLEYYAEKSGKVETLANALGFRDWHSLVLEIIKLEEETGIPDSLAAIGVSPDELDEMVNDALQYRRNLENGPVVPEPVEVKKVYEKSLEGRKVFRSELKHS
ncbi:MAG: iron-containing alcohol dehydrogenase, partial [Thermofilaceae archaeon]